MKLDDKTKHNLANEETVKRLQEYVNTKLHRKDGLVAGSPSGPDGRE